MQIELTHKECDLIIFTLDNARAAAKSHENNDLAKEMYELIFKLETEKRKQ
jgi:hypothetical protein